ncbi:hypothetical protein HFM87_15675 [Blautia producta]|nr:hypothetical protein [Blautia producta]NSG17301.1 hypothetical protein [Blautia producta]NSJ77476.1 hypothetical protein [Blautia producta]
MEAAAESERQAEGWAHGSEDLPERLQDNAKYYSEQAREDSMKTDADRKEVGRLVESVSGIGEQVEKVEGLTKQAQTSATNAALSEQAAKESENNAAQARAGAEVAEDNAELAAQRAEQDKAIVEQVKNLVKQMGQEVLDNKNLVDETAQNFDLKAQQALADVNNAGQTQTERVQTAGNDAVESVKTAQGTATRAVETAKTEAIKAVQTEGTTQAGNVSAEGEKQVQAVRGAAQEIVADRGQIQENKTGIAKLKEDIGNKAPAIIKKASGKTIIIEDSSNLPVKALSGTGEIIVTGKNILKTEKYNVFIPFEAKAGTLFTLITNGELSEGGNIKFIDENGERIWFAIDKGKTKKSSTIKKNIKGYVNLLSPKEGLKYCLSTGENDEYKEYVEQVITAPVDSEQLKTIHTNYPTTVLTSENEISVEYVADTEAYIGKRIKEENQSLQKQILEIQNALISQKISGGGIIQVKDSAKLPIQNLRVFGKSEQVQTTGAQLFNESQIGQYNERTFKYFNIPVGEGNFTLSSNIPKSLTDSSAYIMLISGNVQHLAPEINTSTNGVYSGQSRTFPSMNGYVTIAYRNDANTDNLVTFNKYWYMLNTGETAKPYEPYTGGKPSPSPECPQEIVNAGEKGNVTVDVNTGNLFDINAVKKYEVDNTTLSLSVSGNKIIFNSKISTGKEAIMNVLGKNNDAIKLPLGKYILSYKSNKPFGSTNGTDTVEMYACVRTGDSTVYRSTGTKNYVIFEIKEGDELFLRFDINKSGQSAEFYDIMLNRGEIALPYGPYFNQSLTLSTPNGLLGIKVDSGGNYTDANGQQWICDEIDLARGKYIQRIGRKIFDGAENWSHKITKKHKNNNFQMMIENEKGTINHRSVCNYIRFTNLAWDDVLENLPKIYAYDSQITASFPPESEINSLETWKNYLKEKGDFEIQYVFETPTETELTPETIAAFKILHSNYPTTVISNDENAGMEVSYVADTKHYIDKKFEELNQAIVNTQIALL